MKKMSILILIGVFVFYPAMGFAHEEGTEESHAAVQGGTHEMHAMGQEHAEHIAVLREAASLLQSTRPDLSKELEEIAQDMSQGS